MDIYLTNLKTGDSLQLPMLPEKINVKASNRFESYSIMKIGEVKIPNGTMLDTFTWRATLPGKPRKKDPYIRAWTKPNEAYKFIRSLKAKGGKPIKARLMITETPINCDVYLSDFTATPTGGYGDIGYSITLVQAKKIELSKKEKASGSGSGSKSKKGKKEKKTESRPSAPKSQTYTVKSGDSLWKIAQRVYGNGSEYTKIYDANKATIGSNPNLIKSGQVLTIP